MSSSSSLADSEEFSERSSTTRSSGGSRRHVRSRVREIVPTLRREARPTYSSSGSDSDSNDFSERSSVQLAGEGNLATHQNRSRVREVVPTLRRDAQAQQAENLPQHSNSSSDNESDHGGNIPPIGGRTGDPRYRSIRLGQQHDGTGTNIERTRPTQVTNVTLRARPRLSARVHWEAEFKHKETKKRSSKAVKKAIKIKPKIPKVKKEVKVKEKKESCFSRCFARFKRKPKVKKEGEEEEAEVEVEEELPPTELTPEMSKANSEGYGMMKSVFFPSIPAVLQDLWVYLELGISIAAFGIGLRGTFPIETDVIFQYFYLALATIAMFMALLDGFIYFFQLGSCARGIRFCIGVYKRRKKRDKGDEEEEEEEDEEEEKSHCGMSAATREKLNSGFELVRNLINEFLVYPLLICDLFDFISEGLEPGGSFLPNAGDQVGSADFSFFVIGGFYLILAVYIMRIVTVFGTLISLIRLPSNAEASGTDKDSSLLIKFCIHIIGQIVVHFVIILVLAAKIRNENLMMDDSMNNTIGTMNSTNDIMMSANRTMNQTADMDDNGGGGIIASPFLITAIVMGGLLPLGGIAAFFVVNYFWLREFSIGFWLNMLSMLQGASFAETVFGGDGLSSAEEQANEFLDDSGFDTVKSQIGRLKNQSWWVKFFYPTKVPLVALCGVLYDLALVLFVATLMLTSDDSGVRIVVFTDDDVMTSIFVIAVFVIIVANLHVLLLLNFLLLVLIVLGIVACLYSMAVIPLILFIYLPSIGIIGYIFLFKDTGKKIQRKKANSADESWTVGNLAATESDKELDMSEYNGNNAKEKEAEEEAYSDSVIVAMDFSEAAKTNGKSSPLVFTNTSAV